VALLQRGRATQAGTPETDPLVRGLAQIEANAAEIARQLEQLPSLVRLETEQKLEPGGEPTDLRAPPRIGRWLSPARLRIEDQAGFHRAGEPLGTGSRSTLLDPLRNRAKASVWSGSS